MPCVYVIENEPFIFPLAYCLYIYEKARVIGIGKVVECRAMRSYLHLVENG
jgi:hypothetical protein